MCVCVRTCLHAHMYVYFTYTYVCICVYTHATIYVSMYTCPRIWESHSLSWFAEAADTPCDLLGHAEPEDIVALGIGYVGHCWVVSGCYFQGLAILEGVGYRVCQGFTGLARISSRALWSRFEFKCLRVEGYLWLEALIHRFPAENIKP